MARGDQKPPFLNTPQQSRQTVGEDGCGHTALLPSNETGSVSAFADQRRLLFDAGDRMGALSNPPPLELEPEDTSGFLTKLNEKRNYSRANELPFGWLVIIAGPNRGRDLRLTAGSNALMADSFDNISVTPGNEDMREGVLCSIECDAGEMIAAVSLFETDDRSVSTKRNRTKLVLEPGVKTVIGANTFIFVPFTQELDSDGS